MSEERTWRAGEEDGSDRRAATGRHELRSVGGPVLGGWGSGRLETTGDLTGEKRKRQKWNTPGKGRIRQKGRQKPMNGCTEEK
jgi:hypothetical protein